jgi:hypothetical protein
MITAHTILFGIAFVSLCVLINSYLSELQG